MVLPALQSVFSVAKTKPGLASLIDEGYEVTEPLEGPGIAGGFVAGADLHYPSGPFHRRAQLQPGPDATQPPL